jgi:hypothetical protein
VKESALHRSVARYLSVALPDDCWWTTFPAGGGGKVRGAQLKAMGLKAGVPDILIMKARHDCTAVAWIELKTAKGRASVEQQLCHAALGKMFCDVAICRSLEDVEETLIGWGIVPRATLGRKAA